MLVREEMGGHHFYAECRGVIEALEIARGFQYRCQHAHHLLQQLPSKHRPSTTRRSRRPSFVSVSMSMPMSMSDLKVSGVQFIQHRHTTKVEAKRKHDRRLSKAKRRLKDAQSVEERNLDFC